jgi:hypothetical protein
MRLEMGSCARKVIATLTLLIVTMPNFAFGQSFAYRDKTDFANSSEKGEVTIEAEGDSMRRGDIFHVKYTFHGNGSFEVYNWQFFNFIPLPGQLVIYDENKQYVGNLLDRGECCSQRGAVSEGWIRLSGETFLGKLAGFKVAFVPNTEFDSLSNQLPAGKYYLQMVLYKAFIFPNWFRLGGDKKPFNEMFDKSELCRSNIISVELIE